MYEGWAASGWLVAAGALAVELAVGIQPTGPLQVGIGVALGLALARAVPAGRLWRWQRRLRGRPLGFITPAQLSARAAHQPDTLWLGWGFEWQPAHAQRIHEVVVF